MPLYICEYPGCQIVDNTAVGHFWSRGADWYKEEHKIALCSIHAPTTFANGEPTGKSGKWHDKFPMLKVNDFLKQYPNATFENFPSIE